MFGVDTFVRTRTRRGGVVELRGGQDQGVNLSPSIP